MAIQATERRAAARDAADDRRYIRQFAAGLSDERLAGLIQRYAQTLEGTARFSFAPACEIRAWLRGCLHEATAVRHWNDGDKRLEKHRGNPA